MLPSATALALCLALLLACPTHGESLLLAFTSLLAGVGSLGWGISWEPQPGHVCWVLSSHIRILEQGMARAPCSPLAFHCWLGAQRGTSLTCPHRCHREGPQPLGTQCWAGGLPAGSSCQGHLQGRGGRCYQRGFSAR